MFRIIRTSTPPKASVFSSTSTVFAKSKSTMAPSKRKASAPPKTSRINGDPSVDKKRKTNPDSPPTNPNLSSDPLRTPHPFHKESETHGIVLRKYYPPEMSTARCQAYNDNKLPRPIETLYAALSETVSLRSSLPVRQAVVHWFKMDLRLHDNRALWLASQKAKEAGVPLICLYVLSPEDLEAHLRAPIRVDFMLRTLEILKKDLAALNIPLWIETVPKRKEVPQRIKQLMHEWGASHLFCNMEYEVDELRREAKLVRLLASASGDDDTPKMAAEVLHDTCIVAPGALKSSSGRQYSVYAPWFRSWLRYVEENPDCLEISPPPLPNPPSTVRQGGKLAHLFGCPIPPAPEGKQLRDDDEKVRFRALWPAGEHEALKRLNKFWGTSKLSVHFAAGTLSARTAVRAARERNRTKRLNGGDEGIQRWVGEVAWREFYRHVVVNWPYVCMNKPHHPPLSSIPWSYSPSHLSLWTLGLTGYPLIDASMRCLLTTGYLHNRLRMVVASFLSKDLLLDWRLGEQYFMLHLIDGDFASNNGGWGWAASVGADAQPWFRVFNPVRQRGKGREGGVIHDPWGRGDEKVRRKLEERGYPRMMVDHAEARRRAIEEYRRGLARDV
ncbi:deoxyribodipyrimidine photolyase [Sordaria brevicollis]|uniref:Deoxyribodipyrimidine photolyase n=1 Tax=Sordaria brevicollis TaxID=83679 RepID=A0AAE0U9J3_SORBR|nr:deoxyribodipyrimidine photolyase [Sordaria brevicollis]